jgi:hypothetical protein
MLMTSPQTPGGVAVLAGHRVARVGFGAMQFAVKRPAPDEEAAVTVLRAAVDMGVNHIDTAQFYGAGTSNELIRAALRPYPADLRIVSKVGATSDPAGDIVLAQRPEQLRAEVEANLATLGTERLAVVNLRRADMAPGLRAEGDQLVDLDSQLAEMVALRDEGKIGAIGLSHVSGEQVGQALPVGIACVQNYYNVLERSAEPVLDACRSAGVAWVPYFPLGAASFPGIPRVTDDPTVISIAATLGVTPAQVGLAWLLAHYSGTLLIAGTTSLDHLKENLAAGSVELGPDHMALLDGLASRG